MPNHSFIHLTFQQFEFVSKTFFKEIKEPESYDNVIDSREPIKKLADDTEGRYLGTFLAGNKSVKIVTRDGSWSGDIYLPGIDWLYPENNFVLFHRMAGYSSTVHYSSNTVKPAKDESVGFVNLKGMWCKIGNNKY